MLYRFKSAMTFGPYHVKGRVYKHPRFGGAFMEGCLCSDVPGPRLKHLDLGQRARFWFTEVGYKRCAKGLIDQAKEEGQILQVIRIKNPEPSRIVWQDQWQVLLLPKRKHGKNNA